MCAGKVRKKKIFGQLMTEHFPQPITDRKKNSRIDLGDPAIQEPKQTFKKPI